MPPVRATPAPERPDSCADDAEELDLAGLWAIALQRHPGLREAEADVAAARGRFVQAGVYPNPHFSYDQDVIGSRAAPQGNIAIKLTQEVVTAGKRRLDRTLAAREIDTAVLAAVSERFDILTRIRRSYYNYVACLAAAQVHDENVAALVAGVGRTCELVKLGVKPEADLIRQETALAEADIARTRNRVALEAAWRQLAAAVGADELPPARLRRPEEQVPNWTLEIVQAEVSQRSSVLRQAVQERERALVALERARAEAVPNVSVGGGYAASNVESTAGGVISVDVPLPVWDRKRGRILEAEAQTARADAAVRSVELRLRRDLSDAWEHYDAARREVIRLEKDVLPGSRRSLELVLQGYNAGAPQVTFADVLSTEQAVNAARLTLVEARRSLWLAVADLQGLMQLDLGEESPAAPQAPCP
jgi:cobalt-zinc-cadmium efflux system outer membrane protein